MQDRVLKIVTDHFLNSRDFNGIHISNFLKQLQIGWEQGKVELRAFLESGLLSLIDEATDINPNIIRRGFLPVDAQLKILESLNPGYFCIYPTKEQLISVVDQSKYRYEPYKLRLALGEPQLSFVPFDLSILEQYRNDPRYDFKNSDIQGHIYYSHDTLHERDRVLLQSYGFAYDENLNRSVAVFLRYLSDLPPEHQQLWHFKELGQWYELHPDYFRASINGDWQERVPICSALIEELALINQMTKAMGHAPLFHKDYNSDEEDRPRNFHFLIRPSLDEFNSFILLLDKMLSENINKKFFEPDLDLKTEKIQPSGKTEVFQKGTLQLLDEWVRTYFNTSDWTIWDETISALKGVRKMRQHPAHNIQENVYDQKYFKEQRAILIQTFQAVGVIRDLFERHPKVIQAGIKAPDWLIEGKVWNI